MLDSKEADQIIVDEYSFYYHLANFPSLLEEFEAELDAGMQDIVNKNNVDEYHRIYKDVLLNSQLKDICRYNSKKKEFLIFNNEKNREILLKNVANGIKDNFWVRGKSINLKNLIFILFHKI